MVGPSHYSENLTAGFRDSGGPENICCLLSTVDAFRQLRPNWVKSAIRFSPEGCLTERLQQLKPRRQANRRLSVLRRRHDGRRPRAGSRVGARRPVDGGSGYWQGVRKAACERRGTGEQPLRLWW